MASPDAGPSGEGYGGSPPLTPGSEVLHYRILSELGRGGMAVVYRGLDLRLEREVALKCPRLDRRLGADHLRRFMREARSTAKLSHPNIVPLLDVFDHEGLPVLVMELVDGASLRELLGREGALPLERVLRHAEQLADALRAAHERHILHRDVTPSNVLIGKDGRARLTDFGLAHLYAPPGEESVLSTQSTEQTSGGRVVGTPGYMSPEQLLGREVGPGADLFALGAVIYEMCTAEPAFRSSEQGDLVDAILNREPTSLTRLNYEIPEELERIVRKALAKRADERYQSAAEMIADLRALRRQSGSQSFSQERAVVPVRRRNRLLRPAALAAGLGVLALAGWALWPREPSIPRWTPRQLTSDPGWEMDPALSPGGDFVAYASDRSGNSDIWIVDARGGEPLRLTNDPARDRSPTWFPDGGSLAFVSDRNGTEGIWKTAVLGGSAVLLVPGAGDPAISPDGRRIAFSRRGPTGFDRIFVADLDDLSAVTALTRDEDGLWDHRQPAWSPDGTTICYTDWRDLWLVPAAGGPARRLTLEHANDERPVWAPGGRHVYFSSYRGGSVALWRVEVSSGRAVRLTSGTGPECQPSVSRDGLRLAHSTYNVEFDIVLLDLRSGVRTPLPTSRRETHASITPDGGAIVFPSDREGGLDLWLQPLVQGRPSGPPTRLTDQPGSESIPVWSVDGRWIAYGRVLEEQRDVWISPAAGGPPRRFTEHPAADLHPTWSPDGSRLAFISNRDGRMHVWAAPVADGARTGEPLQLTRGNRDDFLPLWSADGSRLAFIGLDDAGMEVWIAGPGGEAPRPLTSGAGARWLRWDPEDPEALLVSGTWGEESVSLRRVTMRGGPPAGLDPSVVMGGASAYGFFDISRDGSLLVYVAEQVRGDVWALDAQGDSF